MSKGDEKRISASWACLRFSLDTWAVASALAAALLVRAGVLKHIPW